MSRTDELIKRVLELDAAATPGLWEKAYTQSARDGEWWGVRPGNGGRWVAFNSISDSPDYDLIAEYRTLTPLLARMLRRALEELRSVAVSSSWRIRQDAEDAIEEIEETV